MASEGACSGDAAGVTTRTWGSQNSVISGFMGGGAGMVSAGAWPRTWVKVNKAATRAARDNFVVGTCIFLSCLVQA
jgi:hypothetical protein